MSHVTFRAVPNIRSILLIYLVGLVLCLLLRLALWLTYPGFFDSITWQDGLRAQLTGMRFDLAIITQLNALILLALLLPFRFSSHPHWRLLWMTLAFIPLATLLILGVGSLGFFGEVQRHLGAELLFMVDDWRFGIDLILSSRRAEFIGLVLLLLLGGWAWWRLIRIVSSSGLAPGRVQAWVVFALALPVLVLFWRGLEVDGKTLNVVDAHALGNAQLGNLAMNAAFSVIHTSRNLDGRVGSPISSLEANELREQLDITLPNPFLRRYDDQSKTTTAPNIVLIILESWSNQYIDGLSGKDLGVTPNMDRLIEESRVYVNHYAAAQRSIQSLQAILTGVPVMPGQPRLSEGLEQVDMSRIGQLANRRGYQSLFVQSSTRRSFRMDSVAASLGFSDYYGQEDIPLVMEYPQSVPRFGWDYDTLQFFHQRIDELASEGPFFGVAFTGTTHEPFADPGEQFHLYPHDSRSENGYLNTLAYSDWALGEFMAQAQQTEWYKDTVFVITSDHVLRADGASLRTRFRVPLIIHAPERITPGRSTKTVSHYDILPTLVELMGSTEPFVAFGESIFRDDYPDEAWVNQGEMLSLLRSNTELSFIPSQLDNEPQTNPESALQHSLRQRATLFTHLIIEKMNQNRWTLGTGP